MRRTWDVPDQAEAIGMIRAEVRKVLAGWGLATALDDTALVVTELLSNAIRHGAPDITLTLAAQHDQILGSVTDRGADLPRMRDATELDVQGRGLRLVQELTTAWGIAPHSGGGIGKSVWWTWGPPGTSPS